MCLSYLENMPIRYCPSISLHGNPGSIGLNSPLTAEAVRARSFVNKDILLAHSISFKDFSNNFYDFTIDTIFRAIAVI